MKYLLTIIAILFLWPSVCSASYVGYYRLGNTSDQSYNNATLTNQNTVSFTASRITNGANFGSANTNKDLNVQNSLGFTNNNTNRTVSCWVNITTAPTSGNVGNFWQLFSGVASNGGYLELSYYNNSGTLELFNGGASVNMVYPTTLTIGKWYYVVLTQNGTVITIYLNGKAVKTGTKYVGDYHTYGQWFSVGSEHDSVRNQRFLSGKVDEVIVDNTAWSLNKIRQTMSAQSGKLE